MSGAVRPPIVMLAPGNVIHTQRWANGLAEDGWPVLCLSAHGFLPSGWDPRVTRSALSMRAPWAYAFSSLEVRSHCRRWKAELLHVHYASGYGVLGTLSGVRPRLVSVWGMDIFDFPRKSIVHKAVIRHVLGRARRVASTSHVMADEVRRVMGSAWRAQIPVTPFGVDMQKFSPRLCPREQSVVVIGTVKTLAHKYGIDTLIHGFALTTKRLGASDPAIRLRITGGGPSRGELEALVRQLGIQHLTDFTGPLDHAQVPEALRALDIFVAVSREDSESFGVAAIEASACGLPVVVSDAGGLPEVVDDGLTGRVVPRDDPEALAKVLIELVRDPALRVRLGEAGRARVFRDYEWSACVRCMSEVLRGVL